MKCSRCRRPIVAGVEQTKLMLAYQQDDGTVKVYGYQAPDGPLSQATGRITKAWHHKCYHIERKAEARQPSTALPTGYTIAQEVLTRDDLTRLGITIAEATGRGTGYLRERMRALNALAAQLGKAVGDPEVTEAWRAREQPAGYPHRHEHRLEPYHLAAHLHHAHQAPQGSGDLYALHAQLHLGAERDADPGHTQPPPAVNDWRQQVVAEVSELPPGDPP